jgi:hypothetical protein
MNGADVPPVEATATQPAAEPGPQDLQETSDAAEAEHSEHTKAESAS